MPYWSFWLFDENMLFWNIALLAQVGSPCHLHASADRFLFSSIFRLYFSQLCFLLHFGPSFQTLPTLVLETNLFLCRKEFYPSYNPTLKSLKRVNGEECGML